MLTTLKQQLSRQPHTVIGPNTVLKGDLRFTGKLRLEGCVLGSVIADTANDRVELALSAVVHGDLEVPVAVVYGAVYGNLVSDKRVTIKQGGRVDGNVHYKRIDLASGAEVHGEIVQLAKADIVKHAPTIPEDEPDEDAANASHNRQYPRRFDNR